MSQPVDRRHRPGLTAKLLVTGAVKLLPPSEQDRYDTEWRAEVYYSPVGWRWGTAVSLMWGAVAVARELNYRPSVAARQRKGLRCRLGFHKDVKIVPSHPRDSLDYWFECSRCSRYHDSPGSKDGPGTLDGGTGGVSGLGGGF